MGEEINVTKLHRRIQKKIVRRDFSKECQNSEIGQNELKAMKENRMLRKTLADLPFYSRQS